MLIILSKVFMSFYRKYEIETLQEKLFWKLLEKYSEDNEALGTKCWRLSGIPFCFISTTGFERIVIGTWLIENNFDTNFQNALILYSYYYYHKYLFCYYFHPYHYYYYYYHY